MRQATFDVDAGAVLAPCSASLDFSDGSGADCVNEKSHAGGKDHAGCIWSRSAWNDRHGIVQPVVTHDGCNQYDNCGGDDCPEVAE